MQAVLVIQQRFKFRKAARTVRTQMRAVVSMRAQQEERLRSLRTNVRRKGASDVVMECLNGWLATCHDRPLSTSAPLALRNFEAQYGVQ